MISSKIRLARFLLLASDSLEKQARKPASIKLNISHGRDQHTFEINPDEFESDPRLQLPPQEGRGHASFLFIFGLFKKITKIDHRFKKLYIWSSIALWGGGFLFTLIYFHVNFLIILIHGTLLFLLHLSKEKNYIHKHV
jgi:hypothetical protein